MGVRVSLGPPVVGFGFERLIQVVEGQPRVDETTLFDTRFHPVVRDHIRTLDLLWEHGRNKGRNYVCRRLIRRILPLIPHNRFGFGEWLESEREMRERCLNILHRKWNKFKDRNEKFWWETFGILPEELKEVRK